MILFLGSPILTTNELSILSHTVDFATPTATKAKISVVQKSTVASLTPSITPNDLPNFSTNIIIMAIFAALLLLAALTIILMMAMLLSRSCHRSRKKNNSVGPSNSFRFASVPGVGMVNGTFYQQPVPAVTNHLATARPQSLSTNYEDM